MFNKEFSLKLKNFPSLRKNFKKEIFLIIVLKYLLLYIKQIFT